MLKIKSRPLFLTLTLVFLGATFYFMSSPSDALGAATPLSLQKYTFQEVLRQKADDHDEDPTDDHVIDDESISVAKEKALEAVKLEADAEAKNRDKQSFMDADLTTEPFMPKMANETLKAQLGNSAWHLFHTILARYPEKPSKQERSTLEVYIQAFGQVYPCGDCARHFQKLLKKYPPQTLNRKTAALWGCDIHNKVNERLEKPIYDCTTILEDYDCGCGSDEKEKDETLGESIEHLRDIKIDERVERERG